MGIGCGRNSGHRDDGGAAVISGPQTTAGGKNVDQGGLKWLNWDQTAGLSRNDVEGGVVNKFLADGCRSASWSETEALFDSLWGGTNEDWHASNTDGVNWLHSTFGGFPPLNNQGFSFVNVVFGNDGECNVNTNQVAGDILPFGMTSLTAQGRFKAGSITTLVFPLEQAQQTPT